MGVWVDPELARENALWTQERIEYINAHPEVGFYLRERLFHICRAHPQARRVVQRGIVPTDWRCPLGRSACPFAAVTAKRWQFALHLVPAWPCTRQDGSPAFEHAV